MWCVYIYIIYMKWNITQPEKERSNTICSNMDGPRAHHTKWSKRKTNITWHHLYVESKKNDTNELIYKTEIDS